jgi:hypothetical protein
MKKTFSIISIHVIIIFAVAMMASFIPETFPAFFGDWVCGDGCNYAGLGRHSHELHWGFRHWLWCFMSISLFIIHAVRIGMIIEKQTNKLLS